MSKTYTRLTEDERYQIYESVVEKQSYHQIALINRHHVTVSNEMKRNPGLRGYRPRQAHEKSLKRQLDKPKFIKLTPTVRYRLLMLFSKTGVLIKSKVASKAKGCQWSGHHYLPSYPAR